MDYIKEMKNSPVSCNYDVIVKGAGSEGVRDVNSAEMRSIIGMVV